MILVNRCYSITTEESAEDGEYAEAGFLSQNEPMTFRELIDALRYGSPSAWPASGSVREWITHDQGETRAYFEAGEREERTIHYSTDNAPRKARYWKMAMQCAGLLRGRDV